MKPANRDIQQLHNALMAVLQSTQRARSKGDASRLATLSVIASHSGCSPKAISEELSFHPSSITRLVQTLEAEGHVRVTPDPEDGRSCRIVLTPKGRAEFVRLQKIGTERFSLFVSRWQVEEVQTFTRLLAKFEQSKAETTSVGKTSPKSWRQRRKEAPPEGIEQ